MRDNIEPSASDFAEAEVLDKKVRFTVQGTDGHYYSVKGLALARIESRVRGRRHAERAILPASRCDRLVGDLREPPDDVPGDVVKIFGSTADEFSRVQGLMRRMVSAAHPPSPLDLSPLTARLVNVAGSPIESVSSLARRAIEEAQELSAMYAQKSELWRQNRARGLV